MNLSSTSFLRVTTILFGLGVLAFCVVAVPIISFGITEYLGATNSLRYLIMAGAYVTAIAFYIGLYQAWLLLRYIDANTAFSEKSVAALRTIGYCGVVIGAIYISGLPIVFRAGQLDDAPGLIPLGIAFACAPIVIAAFAALLRQLVQSALELKRENDLVI